MEHQLSAYTDCNHGEGLAVLHPVYYRSHGAFRLLTPAEILDIYKECW